MHPFELRPGPPPHVGSHKLNWSSTTPHLWFSLAIHPYGPNSCIRVACKVENAPYV